MPFLRWLRRSPWILLTAATMAALGVLVLLAQWQSDQRWQRYCTEARLRGVKLTLPEFEQPAVDPAQNFAEIPLLRAAFAGPVGNSPFKLPSGTVLTSNPHNRLRGEPTDWAAARKAFQTAGMLPELSDDPLRDVLRALEHYAPELKQWQEGSQRPFCRFPLDLKLGFSMPLNHLGTFSEVATLFKLRMKLHLALGDSKSAFADFHDTLQVYRALAAEPTVVTGMVRTNITAFAIKTMGEGLANGAWAEPELRKIQAELAALDFWQDCRLALSSERAAVNSSLEGVAEASAWKRGGIPRKPIRDNQRRLNRYVDEMLARIAADGSGINFEMLTPSGPETITASAETYYFELFAVIAASYASLEERYLREFTTCNQAIVACALERFKLARGTYPETLAELAPEFCQTVPTDAYSGAALHYQRTPAGSYTLYSIGKDRKDDAARLDDTKSEKEQADAVWLYAPAEESMKDKG